MKIQTHIKRASIALALAVASAAQAVTFSLTVQDDDVRVGETFEVAFAATFDSALELEFFAFDVDPLNQLVANGVLAFVGWSVPAPILEGMPLSPNEVTGVGDFFDPYFGGTDRLLATLSFTALGVGAETVSVFGDTDGFQGISLYDFDNDTFEEHRIESSFDVTVRAADAVPDAPTYGAFPAALLALALWRRRLNKN